MSQLAETSPHGSVALPIELPTRGGERRIWDQLHGSARSLAIANAALAHESLTLVVVADAPAAERITDELRFFLAEADCPVLLFPDWETLPYDMFSPHQDIVSQRLRTLSRLPHIARAVLVSPVSTLMTRLAPPGYVASHSLSLQRGERLALDEFRARLEQVGYRAVGQVMEHGEFAVRGSLLDLFPMGATSPYRIDLFDDEIDTIRRFDPETQRSGELESNIELLPAREFPIDGDAIKAFRARWRTRFEGDPNRCPIYRDVSQGLAPAGIEYYLGIFFEQLGRLTDYLPADTLIAHDDDAIDAAQTFWTQIQERYEEHRHDVERPLLPASDVFVTTEELFGAIKRHCRVELRRFEADSVAGLVHFHTREPTQLPIDARAEDPLQVVRHFVDEFDGRVLFVAESAGRRETLIESFRRHALRLQTVSSWSAFLASTAPVCITAARIERGAVMPQLGLAVVVEAQLFGARAAQRRRRRARARDPESIIRDLTELKIGAPVVHEDHGVGRYRGLTSLDAGGAVNEFLAIDYADGDRLYVPVSSLHLVSRFTGADPDQAPLHRLGSGQWQKARAKAAEQAFDVAAELLDIHARRAARPGHAFEIDDQALAQFCDGFPFEETPDQASAIAAVLEDMREPRAMDRLVCGDVGFGKTEVAMRAAFVAAHAGYQVAVLVPTTLLAQQHFQTFSDRFAEWPIRIELLSRFRAKKERDATVQALAQGKVDIVIGTHQLVSGDITFKRLGLTIIDEEHRFGVRQKERFKALRAQTDVLTLTATPIPRTLNMSLSGLKDLSLIATAPERRLSIKTFVREWNAPLLREAVLREIRRGGQVYFVHNKVENIERIAREVAELVPDANVEIAHGQMRERDLEQVMLDFYHRRFNVLVCTTIIETGIDVPSANTIIVNRADRFGLAQLHQLRGRVGRSHHRAYAYLVVPPRKAMTADAVKRLEAIESLEDLGIGFTLATHDLEIRGAGEILGEGQSGQIQEVGYALYTRMLERAVHALKSGRSPDLDRPLDHGAEVDLGAPALIPDQYLPDVHMRLMMYKRIASAEDETALEDVMSEMIDRFGQLPSATRHLFRITSLKLKASPIGVRKIDMSASGGRIVFDAKPNIDPVRVIELMQAQPERYRLEGSDRLRIRADTDNVESRVQAIEDVLDRLAVHSSARA